MASNSTHLFSSLSRIRCRSPLPAMQKCRFVCDQSAPYTPSTLVKNPVSGSLVLISPSVGVTTQLRLSNSQSLHLILTPEHCLQSVSSLHGHWLYCELRCAWGKIAIQRSLTGYCTYSHSHQFQGQQLSSRRRNQLLPKIAETNSPPAKHNNTLDCLSYDEHYNRTIFKPTRSHNHDQSLLCKQAVIDALSCFSWNALPSPVIIIIVNYTSYVSFKSHLLTSRQQLYQALIIKSLLVCFVCVLGEHLVVPTLSVG